MTRNFCCSIVLWHTIYIKFSMKYSLANNPKHHWPKHSPTLSFFLLEWVTVVYPETVLHPTSKTAWREIQQCALSLIWCQNNTATDWNTHLLVSIAITTCYLGNTYYEHYAYPSSTVVLPWQHIYYERCAYRSSTVVLPWQHIYYEHYAYRSSTVVLPRDITRQMIDRCGAILRQSAVLIWVWWFLPEVGLHADTRHRGHDTWPQFIGYATGTDVHVTGTDPHVTGTHKTSWTAGRLDHVFL